MSKSNFFDVTAEPKARKKHIDVEKFVPGKTQVHLVPPQGCCGNLICFQEFTVTGVGTFTDQQGNKTQLAQLENGMFVKADGIEYTLD